jgi:hypothetical protein
MQRIDADEVSASPSRELRQVRKIYEVANSLISARRDRI